MRSFSTSRLQMLLRHNNYGNRCGSGKVIAQTNGYALCGHCLSCADLIKSLFVENRFKWVLLCKLRCITSGESEENCAHALEKFRGYRARNFNRIQDLGA